MPENTALIAICDGHAQFEKAIAELRRLGFNMTNLSVFGKAYLSDEYVVGCYAADGRLKALGESVAFWDRLWIVLDEGGLFLVPGIGPIVVAGPFVHTLVAAIEDCQAVGGLSALGAALYSLGIPKEDIQRFEIEIRADECGLIALGPPELVTKAKTSLRKAGVSEIAADNRSHLGNTYEVLQMVH